jgi:hypothetical protein
LGIEATSWNLFTRPLLSEGVVEDGIPELVELNPLPGRLKVLPCSVTRVLVEAHRDMTRKLVLHVALKAATGLFVGVTSSGMAELQGAGLGKLPGGPF